MWSKAPTHNGKNIPLQLMLKVYPEALAPSTFVITWRNWPCHTIQFKTFFPLSPTFAGTCSSSSSWGWAADPGHRGSVCKCRQKCTCTPGLSSAGQASWTTVQKWGTDCTVVPSNPGIHIKHVNYKLIHINYKMEPSVGQVNLGQWKSGRSSGKHPFCSLQKKWFSGIFPVPLPPPFPIRKFQTIKKFC